MWFFVCFLTNFYWHVVALQCCVSFYWTTKWISRGSGLVTESCLTLVTPWTVPHHAPLSMGFPRQEYGDGLPFPPGDLPVFSRPRNWTQSPALKVDSLPTEPPGKPYIYTYTLSLSDLPPKEHMVLLCKEFTVSSENKRNPSNAYNIKQRNSTRDTGEEPQWGWRGKADGTRIWRPAFFHGHSIYTIFKQGTDPLKWR